MIVVILQVRNSSERLPGKALKLLGTSSVLEAQMARVEEANADEFWLATTESKDDEKIAAIGVERGWKVMRGHPTDVRARFMKIIEKRGCEIVVRLTGDNPFTHYSAVNSAIQILEDNRDTTEWVGPDEPIRCPIGLTPEAFFAESLKDHAAQLGQDALRESIHVTTGLRMFGKATTFIPEGLERLDPNWRFTVDEAGDLAFAQSFVAALGKNWIEADYQEIVQAAVENPELKDINAHVQPKAWSAG